MKKREMLYYQSYENIKNKEVINLIKEVANLERISYNVNETLAILYNKISNTLYEKETLTFLEYIDSVFIKLAFLPECGLLLKYQIQSYINVYYLSQLGIFLQFRQNEIKLEDEKELKLIVNLFEKDVIDNVLLVQSIIILNYDSLSDTIVKFDLNRIIGAIKVVSLKMENIKNNSLCVERIMLMFTDELEMPAKLRNKIKGRKISKIENTGANIPKKEDAKIVQHDEEQKSQVEKNKDGDVNNQNVISEEGNDDKKKRPNEL